MQKTVSENSPYDADVFVCKRSNVAILQTAVQLGIKASVCTNVVVVGLFRCVTHTHAQRF